MTPNAKITKAPIVSLKISALDNQIYPFAMQTAHSSLVAMCVCEQNSLFAQLYTFVSTHIKVYTLLESSARYVYIYIYIYIYIQAR